MTQTKKTIAANTAWADRQKRAADYFADELRDVRQQLSHIEGFATLTDAHIKPIHGVMFLSISNWV